MSKARNEKLARRPRMFLRRSGVAVIALLGSMLALAATALPAAASTNGWSSTSINVQDDANSGNNVDNFTPYNLDGNSITIGYGDGVKVSGCIFVDGNNWTTIPGTHSLGFNINGNGWTGGTTSGGCTGQFDTGPQYFTGSFNLSDPWGGVGGSGSNCGGYQYCPASPVGSVTVNVVGNAPSWTGTPGGSTVNIGNPVSDTFSASGTPTPSFSESGGLPSGVSFNDNGNGTATISGYPNQAGSFPITVTASNGDGSYGTGTISAGYTLTVNQAPYYQGSDTGTWYVGSYGAIPIAFNGTPGPSTPSIVSGSLPSGLSFNGSAVYGTPSAGTVGSYDVEFQSSNAGGTTDQWVEVQVDAAPTGLALTAPAATVSGTSTITARVGPTPNGGTVSFFDSEGFVSQAEYPGGCSDVPVSGGVATCTTSTITGAGTDSVSATYSGDASYNASNSSANMSVSQASTTVGITSSPNPPAVNQTVTYTATVSPIPDDGTVAFSDTAGYISGCSSQPVDISTGKATCTTSTISQTGTDTVTAAYSGDANYKASTQSTAFTATAAATSIAVSISGAPAYNGTATVKATISPVPTAGTVSFSDSKGFIAGCGSVAVNTSTGVETCTTGALSSVGTDTITLNYSGATGYAASNTNASMTVQSASSSVAVSVSPTSPSVDQTATITATVSPVPGGGTVNFSDGSGGLISGCTAVPVTGQTATCTTATIRNVTADLVTASFTGTTNYKASTGAASIEPVAANTAVLVTAAPSPTQVLQHSTITATVSPVPDGGTVAFADSTGNIVGCDAVLVNTSSGVATCTTTNYTGPATDQITATYNGDPNYNASSSGVYNLTVAAASTSVSMATVGSVTVGSPFTVQATVSPTPDGGTVAMYDADGVIRGCSNAPLVSGVATCTSSANLPSVGTDMVTAVYSGDPTYASSVDTQGFAVGKMTETMALTSTPNPPVVGEPFTITATMSPATSVSGTVDFADTGSLLPASCATATVTAGVATCTSTAPATAGTDTITASYSGDTNHAAVSNTPGEAFTVDEVPTFPTANTVTGQVGAALAFQVSTTSVPAVTSITESGTLPSGVLFVDNGNGTAKLTGTPSAGTGGTYPITFTASNATTPTNTQSFVLVVNAAPNFTSASTATFYVGSPSTYTISTNGYPAATISQAGTVPSGVAFTAIGNGSALLAGSPASGTAGSYPLTLTASNGVGAALVQTLMVIVNDETVSVPTSSSAGGNSGGSSGGGGSNSAPATVPTPTSTTTAAGNSAGVTSTSVVSYRYKAKLTGGISQSESCAVPVADVLERASSSGSLAGLGVNFSCAAGKDRLTVAGSIEQTTKKVRETVKVKGKVTTKVVSKAIWHGGFQVTDLSKHSSYFLTPVSSGINSELVITGRSSGTSPVARGSHSKATPISMTFSFTPVDA